MNTFVCIVLLAVAACARAAPWGLGLSELGYSSAHSPGAPLISHAPIVYSAPAAVIHEPAIVSVKKIVSVPQVVSVRKVVSVPHVHVARYVSAPAPRVTYSYAPSYSSGWW